MRPRPGNFWRGQAALGQAGNAPTTKRKFQIPRPKTKVKAYAQETEPDIQVQNLVIRSPIKKINNHFIPVKKDFKGNLRDSGRAVVDLFERSLARRKGYEII